MGFGSDVPNPGDVKPVSVAGYELLLVRGRDGQVNVYHNICRHRGMKLVKAAGNVRSIRCSYHCWTYGLDGRLLATPSIGGVNQNRAEDFNYGELGLIPVRSDQYFDIIFVNIDKKAQNLTSIFGRSRSGSKIPSTFPFCVQPTRHLAEAHATSQSTGRSSSRVVSRTIICRLSTASSIIAKSTSPKTAATSTPAFRPGAALKKRNRATQPKPRTERHCPSFQTWRRRAPPKQLSFSSSRTRSSVARPAMFRDRCNFRKALKNFYTSRTYFIGETATSPEYKKLRDENTIYWKEVLDEDDGPWREVQAMARVREDLGLQSRFSPHWERALHIFQKFIAKRVKVAAS